jgi:pantoate--beta-alanine ligase
LLFLNPDTRIFDLLPATRAYFGEKDFQQLVIMRNMLRQLNLPIELVACPIIAVRAGHIRLIDNMRI